VLFALLYDTLHLLIGLALAGFSSEHARDLELVALRHELAILRRTVKRPDLRLHDRLVLTALGRRLPGRTGLFSPETILRWHRGLVRRKWSAFGRRRKLGRPSISSELRNLILRLAKENPRWGERRLQGELLKLGCKCSNSPIRSVLRRQGLGPAPRRSGLSWSAFLRAHARAVIACDFMVVNTAALGVLYVLFFIDIHSRRAVFVNCTAHPDAHWVTQQARNLAIEIADRDVDVRLLIRDRDAKFVAAFDHVITAGGGRIARTPYRCPNANAFAERFVKSVRRECTDWQIILDEPHLLNILREYFDHYNLARPHRALNLHAPDPQSMPQHGPIIRTQRLHGLINEYSRAA
jgi:putative transposase